jgi:hypothetical protein
MNITDKRRTAGAAMSAAGCLTYKADVLSPYGVERIRDLTEEQLDDLIARLNNMATNRKQAPEAVRKLRSTVLALLDDLGIKARDGQWQRVNQYLLLPRIAGKLLYEMDQEELKACARKLRAILNKRRKEEEEAEKLRRDN